MKQREDVVVVCSVPSVFVLSAVVVGVGFVSVVVVVAVVCSVLSSVASAVVFAVVVVVVVMVLVT